MQLCNRSLCMKDWFGHRSLWKPGAAIDRPLSVENWCGSRPTDHQHSPLIYATGREGDSRKTMSNKILRIHSIRTFSGASCCAAGIQECCGRTSVCARSSCNSATDRSPWKTAAADRPTDRQDSPLASIALWVGMGLWRNLEAGY
jgi:hypothetical protein